MSQAVPPTLPSLPTPARSKNRTLLIGGIVGAVVLVGAASAAASFFFGAAAPAAGKALPDSVALAVEVNLAPSNAQKLALKGIADKYPSLVVSDAEVDYKKVLYEFVTRETVDAPDFDAEVKPWLGDSLAVGLAVDEFGSLESDSVVVAVDTTDKGKAEAFVREQSSEDMSISFVGNVMVFTSADSGVDLSGVADSPLSDVEAYRADMAKLDGDVLTSVWVGPQVLASVVSEVSGYGSIGDSAIDSQALTEGGHGAYAIKASTNRITVSGVGQNPLAADWDMPDIAPQVEALPDDALAVAGVSLSDDIIDAVISANSSSVDVGIGEALKTMVGRGVAASVGWGDGMPRVGVRAEAKDPAAQQDLLSEWSSSYGADRLGVSHGQEGDAGIVAYGWTLDEVGRASSPIGRLDAYTSVVESGPASFITFVNVNAVRALPEYRQQLASSSVTSDVTADDLLAPVRAAGVTMGMVEGDGYQNLTVAIAFED